MCRALYFLPQVDLLLAMSDFGIFMQMMRRTAKDAAEAAAAETEGKEDAAAPSEGAADSKK